MKVATLDRWQAACAACGFAGTPRGYGRVIRGWSSWGRRYHTLGHLEACLEEFDQARSLAVRPGEVELALWFHDAVYRTRASDNEARSAVLAAEILSRDGLETGSVERVTAAIMATRHQGGEPSGDAALVVDIDLSILGQAEDVYLEFENNVRREYWWVPRRKFAAGRCAILESFLKRPAIYHFAEFRTRYETAARDNLAAAITKLKG
jgi:predicted metal-dependent HD superfamily phosphohydrolase